MSPLVSICIPAWERPALLAAAIKSCLAQTYSTIEIVIADDSRTDLVADAVRPFIQHSRVRYTRNPARLGQAGNTNRLFQLAAGERTVLLHDDDLLLPHAVEMLDRVWSSNPELNACYGKQYMIAHSGQLLSHATESTNHLCFRTAQYAGLQARPLWSALSGQFPADAFMVRTAVARDVGFRHEETVGDACDFDFKLRLSTQPGGFYFIDDYLSSYRATDRSLSSEPTMIDHAFVIARDMELPPDLEPTRRSVLRMRWPLAVRRYVLMRERRTAWQL